MVHDQREKCAARHETEVESNEAETKLLFRLFQNRTQRKAMQISHQFARGEHFYGRNNKSPKT